MSIQTCQIWITVDTDNPDFEDIAKSKWELERLGIPYEGRVGIALTSKQWVNFAKNASRFEQRFIFAEPGEVTVMGFPLTVIDKGK